MPDTKLRPTNRHMHNEKKNNSGEQRFGNVNSTNRNSYMDMIFIKKIVIQ